MTVGELRNKLKMLPQDIPVMREGGEYNGDERDIGIVDFRNKQSLAGKIAVILR